MQFHNKVIIIVILASLDLVKTDGSSENIIKASQETSENITQKLQSYWDSDALKSLKSTWLKARKPFESAIASNLKESYGVTGGNMNELKRLVKNPQELTTGYLFDDELVTVLLINLYLREIPRVLMPDVSFALSRNVIRLETPLNTMFLDAEYLLFRNKSDIIYKDFEPYKYSPFTYEQVKRTGTITIIAENCHLIGEAVVTLAGVTPHVGYSTFRVVNCRFSIEISQPGAAPVIAPYFNVKQVLELQRLMSPPLNEEVQSKLQAAVVSVCNNTAILGEETSNIRHQQISFFECVKDYVNTVVRYMNKAVVEKNQGILSMKELENFNDVYYKIENVTLNGLDMAYSSNRGGPIALSDPMINVINEEIRYYRLQARGIITYRLTGQESSLDWAVEMLDVPVAVKIFLRGNHFHENSSFVVQPWRDHSYVSFVYNDEVWNRHLKGYNLITGYLVNAVPATIEEQMRGIFQDAVKKAEEENDRVHFEPSEPSVAESAEKLALVTKPQKRKTKNRALS